MYVGEVRKVAAVNEYMLHEMAKIRIDELRAEASRARGARGSQGWRYYLGVLGVPGAHRAEGVSLSRGTVEEACCA
jgi:hypothetical protein